MATGEDPTSVAIASIQSAATFPDPNIKYVFRTENGGTQVRRPSGWVPSGRNAEGLGGFLGSKWGSALLEHPLVSQPEGVRGGKRQGLVRHWVRWVPGLALGRLSRCLAARSRSRGSLGR